jgi:hypothetical protein
MEFFFMEGNADQLAIEDLKLEFGWLWQSCHISFTTSKAPEVNVIGGC